ncbi:MAG: metallopeptidase family protein [Asticcacaulis sp.]
MPFGTAPSLADIEAIAQGAMHRLPEAVRRLSARRRGGGRGLSAAGSARSTRHRGRLRTDRALQRPAGGMDAMTGDLPAMIHLFRRPILDEWAETGVALEDLVAHVLIHEAGHHFGLGDDDMEWMEDALRRDGRGH